MITLTLDKKPLSNTKIKALAWDWLEANYTCFKENLRPLAVGIGDQVRDEIKEATDLPCSKIIMRIVLNSYFRQNIYKKALIESDYRYELDGTPVERALDDLKHTRQNDDK